jgi:hypothetical protein
LAIRHGVEITLRLHRADRRNAPHAARQSERNDQTKYGGAHASHRAIHRQVLIPIKDFHG